MKSSPLLPAKTSLDELSLRRGRTAVAAEPDDVHKLRVAAGRLSVWLELGGRHALRDDLRRLRRSAAEVRDLDVIAANDATLASAGARWREELVAERAAAAVRLRASLSSPEVDALVEALSYVPDPDPVCVRSALQRQKRRVLRAGDEVDGAASSETALHRLRRRARRLRYALDWMGADASELRSLQEVLGDLNNLAVELARLELFRGDAAVDARIDAIRREIEARRARAIATWVALRPKIGEL